MDRFSLDTFFQFATHHRAEHRCGGYPYEHGMVLADLVTGSSAQRILEVGTGLGYTAACMVLGNPNVQVDTIDQDMSHIEIARSFWKQYGIESNINTHYGKAEGILRELIPYYDFIFFDGYVPQTKMLIEFTRLLKVGGMLVTANLYIRDPKGGNYLKTLLKTDTWHTGLFADTAISTKL